MNWIRPGLYENLFCTFIVSIFTYVSVSLGKEELCQLCVTRVVVF